jgi:hypothetical protein
LTNNSASFFTTAPPAPVYLSYKWLDVETGAYLDDRRAHRSRLPRTIFPAESVVATVVIVAPERVGKAILKITLVQEGVAWFDEQAAANAAEFEVEILAVTRTDGTATASGGAPVISHRA